MPPLFKFYILSIFLSFNLLQTKTSFGAIKNDTILIVSDINIDGNKITNEKIIFRELTFNVGDTIDYAEIPLHIMNSKANLDKTLLFNFVTISVDSLDNNLSWNVTVEERWYVWPFPIFEYADRNLSAFIKNGDYSRVNYGGYLRIDNFRGKREQIKIRMVLGYRKQVAVQYFTQNLDRRKRHGISVWVSYFTNHEVPYLSTDNRPVYYNSLNGKIRSVFASDLSYQFRPKHNWYHTLTIGTLRANVSDSVSKLNENYFGGGKSSFNMNHIKFEVTLDKRNSKIFPLSGYLIKTELARQGLFKGESIDLWYSKLSGGYYSQLYDRIYTGFDVLGKVSTKTNLPYFLNEALGFRDFIRGYEYYVTNGSQYIINKNSIKFELLPTKVINLPVIPDGKFKKTHLAIFWSIFVDTGYVKPDSNTPNKNLEGNFLYGYGSGIYMVAYYDMVFRVEYSSNIFNEWGIFLHFGTPFLNN